MGIVDQHWAYRFEVVSRFSETEQADVYDIEAYTHHPERGWLRADDESVRNLEAGTLHALHAALTEHIERSGS